MDRISAQDAGPYRALVIGIEHYAEFEPIHAAANDAAKLAQLLRDEYGYKVTLLPDASDAAIKQAFDALGASPEQGGVTERDHLLIYFSGHGEPDPNAATASNSARITAGFWLPTNAKKISDADWQADRTRALASAHWIPRDDYVMARLKELRASQILVVDDSCFAGGVEQPAAADDTNAAAAPLIAEAARTPVARSPVSSPVGGERLKVERFKRVRLWMTAGGDEPVEAPGDGNGTSVFTTNFVAVLEQNEGLMNGRRVFERVSERMLADRKTQTPDYVPLPRAEHQGGDFVFVKKTYSIEQRELALGDVTVQIVQVGSDEQRAKAEQIASLVLNELADIDQGFAPIRPYEKPLHLFLTIALNSKQELVLTLFDRDDDQILTTTNQFLPNNFAGVAANVRAAVFNLYKVGSDEARGKEISVDIVKRALTAQRIQSWDIYGLGGASAYVDFANDGMLHAAALGFRLGADHNLTPWFLVGPAFGFDTTKSETSRSAFFGDLGNGTYSDNRGVSQVSLQTLSGMARATVRLPHGILLPFGYVGVGAAWLKVGLSDEYYVPLTPSDTLPLNIVNRRMGTSGWALAWEIGSGTHLLLSSRLSLVAQVGFFSAHHNMKYVTQTEGVNQARQFTMDFQPIRTVLAQAGAAVLF